jgi:hypothetical protein
MKTPAEKDELKRLREQLRWRCAKDKPPTEQGRYLTLGIDGKIRIYCWFMSSGWFLREQALICAWLPIPRPQFDREAEAE